MKTNKRMHRLGGMMKLSAFALLLAACGQPATEEKKEPQMPLKIGATLDLTGPNAVYGEQVKQGIDLAVEEINAAGGVNGAPVTVLYQDSRSDAKIAVSNAQRFISVDGCIVLMGEISSSATQAMIPVVEQAKAFLFAPASSSSKLTNASPHFARNWPSDVAEAGSAAKYAWEQAKARKAAILFVNSDYGAGLKDKFLADFQASGGKVDVTEPFAVDAEDYRTVLLKVKQGAPDIIYLAGNPKEMGRCMKQMREAGITTPVVANTGFLQADCLQLAGSASEGVIIPTPGYDPKAQEPTIAKFYGAFTKKYGGEPSMVNANAYDAVYLIADAFRTAGPDGTAIASLLRNKKNYAGAVGTVSFVNGDVEVPIIFKVIKAGKPEPLI